MSDLPDRLTQAEGLEVHEAQDGLVVFNPETDRVHHLNGTAAVLFELCDGSRDTVDLPAFVAELFSLQEPPGDAVTEGLSQLMEQGVLVQA
jgi:hypothetical protein